MKIPPAGGCRLNPGLCLSLRLKKAQGYHSPEEAHVESFDRLSVSASHRSETPSGATTIRNSAGATQTVASAGQTERSVVLNRRALPDLNRGF